MPQGYLGAFPENGFAPPLLAQIAQELRAAYPAIFAGHPLLYAWAFKYGAALRGTEIHADEAAINVNFWIYTRRRQSRSRAWRSGGVGQGGAAALGIRPIQQ